MHRHFLILSLMLSACAGPTPNSHANEINLHVLASGGQCGKAERTSIVEIDTSQTVRAGLPDSTPLDGKNERVFMISMGTRRTAGYSLSLAQPQARLNDQVLSISIVWHEPTAGSMVAQVITQPCLIVAVKRDKYREVRAVDQNGVERARLAL